MASPTPNDGAAIDSTTDQQTEHSSGMVNGISPVKDQNDQNDDNSDEASNDHVDNDSPEQGVDESNSNDLTALVDKDGNDEDPKEERTAPSIMYKVEFKDKLTGARENFESETPFKPLEVSSQNVDKEIQAQEASVGKAPLEIIIPIDGHSPLSNEGRKNKKHGKKGHGKHEDKDKKHDDKSKPVEHFKKPLDQIAFKDIKIWAVGKATMVIRSQLLLKALRQCVTYYPTQTLSGEEIEINEPFPIIVHHLDQIKTLEAKQELDFQTQKQLKAMLAYIENFMKGRINSAIEKLQEPTPRITFQDTWLLFKPGTDIYWSQSINTNSDFYFAGVVIGTAFLEEDDENEEELEIKLWTLQCDGKTLGRDNGTISIQPFEGEREVTSLNVFPSHFQDKKDGGEIRHSLIKRGLKTYQILHGMPKQMHYSGFVFETEKTMYRGNCMVDTREFRSNTKASRMLGRDFQFLNNELNFQGSYSDMIGVNPSEFIFSSFHHIEVAKTATLPSDRHYFLLSGLIGGFALDDKTWKIFLTDSLVEIKPTMAMSNLHIDPDNLAIVESITHAQTQSLGLDQAHSKGEGHVVLLHGSPGVGKTYTVECIAQSTGRPLIALSMGDLVVGPNSDVERTLMYWFGLAEQWKAILLLDEADIFLERRATRDIQRNGIVSIFLRRMEYFRGLVFLTTNRVGHIDDAFISRVSAVIQYDHLTDDTRKKIWQGFFRKLEEESKKPGSKKVTVEKYAQKFLQNDPDVRDLHLNGREIRNTLQTAISLASYEAFQNSKSAEEPIEVEEDHFRKVITISRKFRKYMKSITGMEEDARAKARQERPHPDRMLDL